MSFKQTWHGDRIMRQANRGIERSLEETGDEAVKIARRLVPVDTGKLRASIHRSPIHHRGGIAEVDLIADATNDSGEEYGVYVELGTQHTRAQPFIEPAAEEAGMEVQNELKREFRRIK